MNQPVLFQKIESACVLLASIYFYYHLHFNGWVFILLLFSMDIFMLGYLKNNTVGAYAYNVGHSYIIPALLIVLGVFGGHRDAIGLGLIWLSHIGLDRALGYGLKDEKGFKHTHLTVLGKNKK